MEATNPYQPPADPISSSLEQKYAARLLSLRDKHLTFGVLLRFQAKAIVVLLVVFGIAITYFAWLSFLPGVYAMIGGLAGVLLRDLGVARVQKRLWPIQAKLQDWTKVERMAAGEQ